MELMSSAEETISTKRAAQPPIRLWLRQIAAIMRLELKKNFFGKRAVLVYLLALMPIGLLSLIAILRVAVLSGDGLSREWLDFSQYPTIFSAFYNGFILRTVVFFGCAWIFMNLFRGEIVDRSLHYYFLSSVHREVLITGKYISGLVTSAVLAPGNFSTTMINPGPPLTTASPMSGW